VDLAFLSVGDITAQSTMAALNLITKEEMASLRSKGATGDVCSHWINVDGEMVDHPLNSRAVGLLPGDLREIKDCILVSGGKAKVEVIHGALRAKLANRIVTDEQTARQLVSMAAGRD
jgi:lsr operon transcriptional repressor